MKRKMNSALLSIIDMLERDENNRSCMADGKDNIEKLALYIINNMANGIYEATICHDQKSDAYVVEFKIDSNSYVVANKDNKIYYEFIKAQPTEEAMLHCLEGAFFNIYSFLFRTSRYCLD